MPESIIILDVIADRASPSETAQLCTDLADRYFSQSAQANTAYTFAWGSDNTDLFDPVKITVGAVEFLLEYDGSAEKVKLTGTCNPNHWGNFAISGTTLRYNDGSFEFTSDFVLISGTDIEITIQATSTTTIEARA